MRVSRIYIRQKIRRQFPGKHLVAAYREKLGRFCIMLHSAVVCISISRYFALPGSFSRARVSTLCKRIYLHTLLSWRIVYAMRVAIFISVGRILIEILQEPD